MERVRLDTRPAGGAATITRSRVAYGAVLLVGAILFWLSRDYPAHMPVWGPWAFSAPEYLAIALALLWYTRGLARTPAPERPEAWRRIVFVTGLLVIYAVLQTRFDYLAQHMFFLNRIQHVVMHHLGPFLIALAWPGGTLDRGMPHWARRVAHDRRVAAVLRVVQQPWIASVLFVGLFALWLVPAIHFRAMIDARLYAIMNWSMVVDGILFWALVLDPRPSPPARIALGMRALLSALVMFPQIGIGAIITLADHDLYPYYALCGRIIPSMSAIADQAIGGSVIWFPTMMMSVAGVLVVLHTMSLRGDDDAPQTNESNALAPQPTR